MAIVFGRPRGEILGALRKLVLLSWVPIHEGGSEAEAMCPILGPQPDRSRVHPVSLTPQYPNDRRDVLGPPLHVPSADPDVPEVCGPADAEGASVDSFHGRAVRTFGRATRRLRCRTAGLPTCGHDIGAAGSPPRRGCQVAVVSPFPFQATFDCALSSAVRGTPHPADTGLLLGRRPFHHLPTDPPVRHLPRAVRLCRFCSVARTLARRAPARPRVPRRGDFPQRPVDSDADHRQLPSASWRCAIPLGGEKPSAGSRRQTR